MLSLPAGFRVETIADLDRSVFATVQLHSTGKRGPNVQVACVSGSRPIQGWLGHRSITSTAVYTALASNRFKDFWQD